MVRTMARFDVLLTAANFRPAPRIEKPRDSTEFFQRPNLTAAFNVTANPTISICNGFSASGLPLACQIAGKPFDEATALRVAHAYQQSTAWLKRRPELVGAALTN
jgi:aspartyl-tRNA(Asn)/glutamyl-tRNA(Gln) amidotransferase subunit A